VLFLSCGFNSDRQTRLRQAVQQSKDDSKDTLPLAV